jgi:hypothetical protein
MMTKRWVPRDKYQGKERLLPGRPVSGAARAGLESARLSLSRGTASLGPHCLRAARDGTKFIQHVEVPDLEV